MLAVLLTFCNQKKQEKHTADDATSATHGSDAIASTLFANDSTATNGEKLIIYYFHTNFRCKSCTKLQELTSKAITSGFSQQLGNGRIAFMPVHVEQPGNEHFSEEYKLYTKSVILSDVKNGQEAKWKNLDKVWTLLGDEKKFLEYIQTEVKTLL